MRNSRGATLVQVAAWIVGLLIVVPNEWSRFVHAQPAADRFIGWLINVDVDRTVYLPLLIIAPAIWFVRRRVTAGSSSPRKDQRSVTRSWIAAWIGPAVVAAASWSTSAWIAALPVPRHDALRMIDLPPAYHDEFSYLFQAKTFLAGRMSFPGSTKTPELFDQMHVVNVNGKFASRYFPGTGAWLAPFVAAGHPYRGQWLAGALAAAFLFALGRELGGNLCGWIAGLLLAVAPGMGIFSNLLLAHHPTLLGLMLFAYLFVRMLRTGSKLACLGAGCGLCFAMLCRPLTAAGFALPFGVWFFAWLWMRGENAQPRSNGERARFIAAMGAPLVFGIGVMLAFNHAITGRALYSPYELYTQTYTPRHVYGFDNRVRGERHLGPRVIAHYDEWAENLTPQLAARNVHARLLASWKWTLGMVPLILGAVVFFGLTVRSDRRWWLVPLSILSLHAVHVPYWFVGIMEWHYVFETCPLWLLMFAGATTALFRVWHSSGRILMPAAWCALIGAAIAVNYVAVEPLWSASRVSLAAGEVMFPRLRYYMFDRLVEQSVTQRPALVLIEGDPADRSIDLVRNDPDLSSDVLFSRFRPGETNVDAVRRAFPDRALYYHKARFEPQGWRIEPIDRNDE